MPKKRSPSGRAPAVGIARLRRVKFRRAQIQADLMCVALGALIEA
jgi:hypothetical protein